VSAARFHPAARVELLEAARFYEERLSGLGVAFVAEVERVCSFVASRPTAGAPLGEQLRRLSARRFPYTVIYRVSRNDVEIIAIAHQHRRPGYWRGRL
jgi:plasmid stabilization system protein ParE